MAERIFYEFLAGGQWWDIKNRGGRFFHRPTNGKSFWRPSLSNGITAEDLAIIQSKLINKK